MLTSRSEMALARDRGNFEYDDLTNDSKRTCGTGLGAQNRFGSVRQHQGVGGLHTVMYMYMYIMYMYNIMYM